MNTPMVEPFVDISAGYEPVRGYLHLAAEPSGESLVLTHGAGGNCETPVLVALARTFSEAGVNVLRCDLPFRQARPRGAPSRGNAVKDQAGLRRAVELLRERFGGRVYLGGQSYGGRQASMLAASDPSACDGLLLLSYPLHPPGRHEQMRTAHFSELRTPVLFVSGTKDDFGTPDELQTALKLVSAPNHLLQIVGGTHSLLNKKNAGELPGMILRGWQEFFRQNSAAA